MLMSASLPFNLWQGLAAAAWAHDGASPQAGDLPERSLLHAESALGTAI